MSAMPTSIGQLIRAATPPAVATALALESLEMVMAWNAQTGSVFQGGARLSARQVANDANDVAHCPLNSPGGPCVRGNPARADPRGETLPWRSTHVDKMRRELHAHVLCGRQLRQNTQRK